MHFRIIFFGMFLLPVAGVWCQQLQTPIGARALGLGQAATCLADTWSALNNPAGLSAIDHPSIGFGVERSPALPGANRLAAVFSLPVSIGTAGLGISRFGDELFSEQHVSASFSNRLGLASLGLRLDYIQYHAEGFGTRNLLSLGFGGIADLTPSFSVGAQILHLNQPFISKVDNEQLPAVITMGVAWRPEKQLSVMSEVEKQATKVPVVRTGLEYEPNTKFKFRSGFNFNPKAVFIGLGFNLGKLLISYAYEHPLLAPGRHAAAIEYALFQE